MLYSGIVDFRLKHFSADNTLNGITNFGEVTPKDIIDLKELSDERSVGMIICSVEMLTELRDLLKQINESQSE